MNKPLADSAAAAKPTSIRHLVVAAAALTSVLLYLDRFCVSFAEIYIKEDLGLTDEQVAWMLSAFFWTYALAQVPSGWFSDRFGSRPMLTLYILMWSLFTALTGLAAYSFAVIMLLRFGFGLAQAGAYPTSASILSKWVPFSNRGLASSIVAVGGRVGGVLAFSLTGTLILWFVPVSVSSLLKPGDLLDPWKFARQLTAHERGEPETPAELLGGTLLASFPSHVQSAVREAAAVEAPKKPGESKNLEGLLLEPLNEVIRAQANLFDDPSLEAVSLDPEAVALKRRLRDGETISQSEQERLNRLILQAVYPASIRKIYGIGWRPVMTVFGVAGLIVAGFFWLSYRERPELHPWVNSREIELIEHGRPHGSPSSAGKIGAIPIVPLVTSVSMWLCCLQQWFTNIGWVFLVTWLPRYLRQEHLVSADRLRWLTMIPLLCGWVGMLYGGTLTDWLVRKLGLRWGRALPMSLSRFLAMAAYLVCLIEPSLPMVLAAFSVVAFATDLGTGSVWAYNQDVGGRHVGSILGWGNMWGNLGAAVAPPLMIAVIGPDYDWKMAFIVCATSFLLSGLVALGVDATKPIRHDESPSAA